MTIDSAQALLRDNLKASMDETICMHLKSYMVARTAVAAHFPLVFEKNEEGDEVSIEASAHIQGLQIIGAVLGMMLVKTFIHMKEASDDYYKNPKDVYMATWMALSSHLAQGMQRYAPDAWDTFLQGLSVDHDELHKHIQTIEKTRSFTVQDIDDFVKRTVH